MTPPFAAFWVLLGALLVALAYGDIFLTVLHPNLESRLSSRVQQALWRLLRTLQHRIGFGRHTALILGFGLPLMVGGLIVFWLLLIGLGFACIYYPWIGDPAVFEAGTPVSGSFFDALYFSAVTLATLGYGDVLPLTPPFRLLAVAEALTGAVTVSASVAYILAVYPALARQRTLARALNAEVAGQSDALPLLRRYRTSEDAWHADLFPQLRELALNLMDISESHETHPVLYYAHPRNVQHSFVRVLVTTQSIVATLRYGLSIDENGATVKHPQVLFLEQSLDYCLNQLGTSIHIGDAAQADDAAVRERILEAYTTLCRDLETIGVASSRTQRSPAAPVLIKDDAEEDARADQPERARVVGESLTYRGEPEVLDPALDLGASSPAEAYLVFRLQTDPLLSAYAEVCGYSIDEVRADSSTTWWTGGHNARGLT